MSGPSGLRSGLGQAFAVLEEVARSGPSLSANGIARALGMPRTSAYRLINTLVGDEYLLRHPTMDGFVLGVRVVELAHIVAPRQQAVAPAIVAGLRAETGEAIHFVRYPRGRVVVVDEDPAFPLLSTDRTRRHLASTAIGRLLLAAYAPPLSMHDDRVAVDEVVTSAMLAGITAAEHRQIAVEVAARDAAFHAEPDGHGRACLAVPVRGDDGRLVAALAIATTATRMERVWMQLPRLREAAVLLAPAVDDAAAAAPEAAPA